VKKRTEEEDEDILSSMKPAAILFLLLPFLPACSSSGPEDPLAPLVGYQTRPSPDLRGLDWGGDPLWKSGGLVLRRGPFEAYLCERFARDWIRTRAVLALFERGLYPGVPEKIRIPGREVLALRSRLAGRAAGGDEKELRRKLLALGWGEVSLLDRLKGRLLVERLASLPRKERKALPEGAALLLSERLPPLLPSGLEDLAGDSRERILRHLAAGKVVYFLERRTGGGTVLAWSGRTPLVRTEEILVDLLGVLTETERRRAFREYLALRKAEDRLGRTVLPLRGKRTGKGERSPAGAWMDAVREAFLSSPEGRNSPPLPAGRIRKAALRLLEGEFLLVPALRAASGRPGFPGDQRRALAGAKALRKELEEGRTSFAAAASKVRAGMKEGTALGRWNAFAELTGKRMGLKEMERAFATPLDGLGLGENPAWSLFLFAERGKWILTRTWWGPLLFRLGKEGEIPEQEAPLSPSDLE